VAERRYSDEEVEEILRRALTSGEATGTSHDELVEAAAEVGIAPEAIEEASRALAREQAKAAKAKKKKRRGWRKWFQGFASWGVVSGVLVTIDMMTAGGPWWQWPVLIWGAFVALDAINIALGSGEDEEDEEAKTLAAEAEKLAAAAERSSTKKKRGKSEELAEAEVAFERAVEQGVAALLTKVAGKIEEVTTEKPPPDTDFGRFVAKKKGTPVRVEESSTPPRARVDAETEDVEEVEAEERRSARARTVD